MMPRPVWILVFLLGGCGGVSAPEPRTFDLGLAAPRAALPPVRIGQVLASAPFEGTDMHYRLAWRNAAEIAPFAHSRWAATPAEMLRKQLLRSASEKTSKCGLRIEIQEFTQVFTAKEASEARVELRAWVDTAPGKPLASRGWNLVEPNAGADATSGAAAFARAVDRAVGEIGAWVAAQPGCS